MMLRVLSIALSGFALWVLWVCYGELKVFRGTVFWDFRFLIYACLAFLGLGLLEWCLGWLRRQGESRDKPD